MDSRDPGHEYVERMRAEGYTDLDIRDALKDAGWNEEQIEAALAPQEDGPPLTEQAGPPRERPQPEQRREREPVRTTSSDGTGVWVCVAVGCVGMLLIVAVIGAAILFPVFARAREKARMASCQSNLKQIGLAYHMYAQDHADALPPAPPWPDRLQPYLGNNAIYSCPSDQRTSPPTFQGQTVSYTMSTATGGVDISTISAPAQMPLCYDGTKIAGGVGDVKYRHNSGANCAYVDGHVKWIADSAWKSSWTIPTPAPGSTPAPAPEAGGEDAPSAEQSGPTPDAQSNARSQMDPLAKARVSACESNLKQVSLGMRMYISDYDDHAPPAGRWPEAAYPYLMNEELYVCPSDADPHRSELRGYSLSYTINEALDGAGVGEIARPSETIMVFDGTVMVGGADEARFRHRGHLVAGFADGHTVLIPEGEWEQWWQQATSGEAPDDAR